MSKQKKVKKKKIRSHVKRVKLAQAKNPVGKKEYRKRLAQARRLDFFRRFFLVLLIVVIALVAAFLAGNFYLKNQYGKTLMGFKQEADAILADSRGDDFILAQASYVYSSDGTKMAELSSDTDATYLEYEEIPQDAVNAFVAVEDRTFWENKGIDTYGIARALVTYLRTRGSRAEGASTITQQLARTIYLTQDKTTSRKLTEIFLARGLAEKYSKKQIMEFYCNNCCFANGIYGLEDAAQAYFRKSAGELSLSQIAYLCAIPNRPEYYNPYNESERALTRRDKILRQMYEAGYITKQDYDEAINEKIKVKKKKTRKSTYNYETTYAVNCAVRYLMKADGFKFNYEFADDDEYKEYNALYEEAYSQAEHKLYTGGYKINTTIDLDVQKEMQNKLNEGLDFNDEKSDSGIYALQGAMTVLDNANGKVISIIGGREQTELKNTYSLNRAYQSYRQPGSTFKPIVVYTPALENGYNPYSMLKNIDVTKAKTATAGEVSEMRGSQMTLRRAVANSVNGCAYWLFNELGASNGLNYATDMQFSKIVKSDYTLSAALGGLTHGVTTVEMANAYYTIENHGEYTQTDCIDQILNADGDNIYTEPSSKQVYTQEAADSMTDVLMGVITDGTARNIDWYSYCKTDAAGKTGTTNNCKDGWFCGYTPLYTIAVWVGYDQPKVMSDLYGGTYPAQIWREAMRSLIADKDVASFEIERDNSGYDEYINEVREREAQQQAAAAAQREAEANQEKKEEQEQAQKELEEQQKKEAKEQRQKAQQQAEEEQKQQEQEQKQGQDQEQGQQESEPAETETQEEDAGEE